MKALLLAVAMLATGARAEGARFAVHPLEARELTADQREKLVARFAVMLARVPEIRITGVRLIDEALAQPAGKDCETRDAALRFLATDTGSFYGVFVRIRPDPSGTRLLVTARVVRADGALVRRASIAGPIEVGVIETGADLLAQVVEELELDGLSSRVQVVSLLPDPTVLDRSSLVADSWPRRPVGYTLIAVGAVALVAGGILAGIAAGGLSGLKTDRNGALPASQVANASRAMNQSVAVAVLIPVGAIFGVAGVLLGLWPSSPSQRLAPALQASASEPR